MNRVFLVIGYNLPRIFTTTNISETVVDPNKDRVNVFNLGFNLQQDELLLTSDHYPFHRQRLIKYWQDHKKFIDPRRNMQAFSKNEIKYFSTHPLLKEFFTTRVALVDGSFVEVNELTALTNRESVPINPRTGQDFSSSDLVRLAAFFNDEKIKSMLRTKEGEMKDVEAVAAATASSLSVPTPF
jgi:hypothetical protein